MAPARNVSELVRCIQCKLLDYSVWCSWVTCVRWTRWPIARGVMSMVDAAATGDEKKPGYSEDSTDSDNDTDRKPLLRRISTSKCVGRLVSSWDVIFLFHKAKVGRAVAQWLSNEPRRARGRRGHPMCPGRGRPNFQRSILQPAISNLINHINIVTLPRAIRLNHLDLKNYILIIFMYENI